MMRKVQSHVKKQFGSVESFHKAYSDREIVLDVRRK